MKPIIFFVIVLFVSFGSVNQIWGDEPVAPMVPVRADLAGLLGMTQAELDAMLEDVGGKVPTKSEVEVPIPEDARLFGGGNLGETDIALLVSNAAPEAIHQYYSARMANMPGWHWSEEFNLFYRSDDVLTHERLMSFSVSVIEVGPLAPEEEMLIIVDEAYRSSLRSFIKITYPAP